MSSGRTGRFLGVVALSCLPAVGLWGDDALAALQARFDRETDSVKKAKLLSQLGRAEFQDARSDIAAGNDLGAVEQIEKYYNNARAASEALEKAHPDAERQPGGYRQLEEQVREAARFARDAEASISADLRPPLQFIRQDLLKLDKELLDRLFPGRPGAHTGRQPAAGAGPAAGGTAQPASPK